jgi:ribosomal-protein-alanine N-acetyltransferase
MIPRGARTGAWPDAVAVQPAVAADVVLAYARITPAMSAADLNLVSASFELLAAAVDDEAKLARLLGATIADGWAGFPESLPVLRDSYARNPGAHAWGTLFFVLGDPRTLVGLGGYKAAPSTDGIVEIGYAIAPAFRGRGLATSAVQQMVARGFGDPQVRFIDAHTLAGPNASTRVLEKSGFEMLGVLEDPGEGPIWHWRLSRTG